eukprot:6474829-Amphidinium_carterae.1
MSAQVPRVFQDLATKVRVPPQAMQILQHLHIESADEYSYRLPSPQAVEDFLAGFFEYNIRADGTIYQNATPDPAARARWLQGPEAASLRRLYEVSKALAAKELHKLIEEPLQGEAPRKLTPTVIADLEHQAGLDGMPPLDSDTRPGATCLAKVHENFRLGGDLRYLQWEEFTSEELEGRARRQGLSGKDIGFKVIPSESGLRGVPLSEAYKRSDVNDLMVLTEIFQLRAAAHAIVNVVHYDLYLTWGREIIKALCRVAPEAMRTPTLNEARLFDRLVHEQILPHVARGDGSLEEGL